MAYPVFAISSWKIADAIMPPWKFATSSVFEEIRDLVWDRVEIRWSEAWRAESCQFFSGQWVVYELAEGGANDLGLLHIADGATRRLTTTPESEEGAEFTPDGKTVLFRRVQIVQRITAVDLSKMLAAKR